ncbi:MAG: GDP-mannose 4,6-dehydratase [Elusimicrobia bacterium]|nr:GDP-mannose 4,6-dehydratase [Elusimicrobiota bacterium]
MRKTNKKKVIICGITGQDGSYLAELLLKKNYEVHGIVRRSSNDNFIRINHLLNRITLHFGDVLDSLSLLKIISEVKPDEVYNLAAQSQVYIGFDIPEYTSNVTGLGALRLLECIKLVNKNIKYFQAVSSEIFGDTKDCPQNESTQLNPKNPYGISKMYAYQMTKSYRDSYNMFACNGILYNHESPRRSENFVTRKITKAIAKIIAKEQNELFLGNIDDKRDWGYAKDYVEAMYLMLQQDKPDDYIISTGEIHSVRDFLDVAFKLVNLDWHKYVKINQNLVRPLDHRNVIFQGDNSKAKKNLNWKPKTSFNELVKLMVESDLKEKGINL